MVAVVMVVLMVLADGMALVMLRVVARRVSVFRTGEESRLVELVVELWVVGLALHLVGVAVVMLCVVALLVGDL